MKAVDELLAIGVESGDSAKAATVRIKDEPAEPAHRDVTVNMAGSINHMIVLRGHPPCSSWDPPVSIDDAIRRQLALLAKRPRSRNSKFSAARPTEWQPHRHRPGTTAQGANAPASSATRRPTRGGANMHSATEQALRHGAERHSAGARLPLVRFRVSQADSTSNAATSRSAALISTPIRCAARPGARYLSA